MTKVMARTVDMSELAALSGASAVDIQNWLKRLSLTTRLAKTRQGKARRFNRDNAVEICLIARLVRSGIEPALAAKRIRFLFKQLESGEELNWVVFFGGEGSALEFLCLDEPPNAEALNALDDISLNEPECVYVLINAARLVDRVDAHFAAQEAEK